MESRKETPERPSDMDALRNKESKTAGYVFLSAEAYAKAYEKKMLELEEAGLRWEPYDFSIFSRGDKIFLSILVLVMLAMPVLLGLVIAFFGVSA